MNREDDSPPPPPYLSNSPTYPRYEDVGSINPYPSRIVESDNWFSTRPGYGYRERNPSSMLGDRLIGLGYDQHLDRPGYGNINRLPPARRVFGLDHHHPSSQRQNTGFPVPAQHRPMEARVAVTPSSQTSMAMDPSAQQPRIRPQPQLIIIGSNLINGSTPRFPISHRPTPRSSSLNQETDPESKLTKQEQEQVLKKLTKQIYNPNPNPNPNGPIPPMRVNLYYRDLNRDPNYLSPKQSQKDEDRKRCAVCLEDFEDREEVMVTPCNHIFHEECIVPWVKSHAQCPVCRSVFCERIKENGPGLGANYGERSVGRSRGGGNGLFEDELLWVAVDEAFPWEG